MSKLGRILQARSIEAFLLSLEIINKITVSYRLESFTYLFCNAWELLLKAHLLKTGQNIFYKKKKGKLRRSLSLRDCLDKVFTNLDDAVRLNIERIEELRDNATHLFVPVVPADVLGLFQAGVINYAKKLKEWTGADLATRVPLGMMALVYDVDPSTHSLDSAIVRRNMTPEGIKWLRNFQQDIRSKAKSVEADVEQQFYIPINLRLAIVKNPSKADIVLGSGQGGTEAMIVEVAKDPDKTHPYRQKDVLKEMVKRCSPTPTLNQYDFLCVRKVFKVENKREFYYKSKFAAPQYSEAFIDWLIEQYQKDNAFFTKAKKKFREIQS